ncbi:TolC family protein [Pseudomonas fluorescens]|nr:TolC family protein [Pseudomonas fluorescens]
MMIIDRYHHLLLSSFAIAVVLLLPGCSWLRSTEPARPLVPERWQYAQPGQLRLASDVQDFWSSLGDPVLPLLLDRAMQNNDDLKLSALQLKLAQLQSELANTSLWPDVLLESTAGITRPFSTQYGVSPRTIRSAGVTGSLSYSLDIWGAEAAQRDAADINAQASEDDWHAARLNLEVSVTQGRWQLGYLNRVIANADADLEVARNTRQLAEARYSAGATTFRDVILTRQNLATQEAAQTQNRSATGHVTQCFCADRRSYVRYRVAGASGRAGYAATYTSSWAAYRDSRQSPGCACRRASGTQCLGISGCHTLRFLPDPGSNQFCGHHQLLAKQFHDPPCGLLVGNLGAALFGIQYSPIGQSKCANQCRNSIGGLS